MAARRSSSSASGKQPFNVDALWELKRIGAPTLAPDGHAACAPVTSFSFERNAGSTELWVTDELNVTVAGVGSVSYWGQPKVFQKVSALARMNALGAKP